MGNSVTIFGGNWNEAGNSGSRCGNFNNSSANSNINIACRGLCEDIRNFSFYYCYGIIGRSYKVWSAVLSCFGEYSKRFRKTTSNYKKLYVKVVSDV